MDDISPSTSLAAGLDGAINLLFLIKSSFDEGGGVAAIVGARRRGSLSFKRHIVCHEVVILFPCMKDSRDK